jgi:hypothetical protein
MALAVALMVLSFLQGVPIDQIHAAPLRASEERACDKPTPIVPDPGGWREARGATEQGEAWALLFNAHRHAERVKIVWRITGSGPFRITAHNARFDVPLAPVSGPTEHSSSNWNRPGDEWGTRFVFPHAGCWRIDVTRGEVTARFWFSVE